MKAKEVYLEDGQWIEILRRGDRLICCDCHLTHRMYFRVRNNRLFMRAFRDVRSTAQRRKKKVSGEK